MDSDSPKRPSRAGRILVLVHVLLALVLAIGALTGSADEFRMGMLAAVLLAGMALGVSARSRWVMAPGCLVILMLALFAAAVTIGNIAWPEYRILQFVGAALAIALFEGGTVLWVLHARKSR